MNKSTQDHQKYTSNNSSTNEITSFWHQGEFNSFLSDHKVTIHYAIFIHKQKNQQHITDTTKDYPAIVVVPGRGESYLKYQELIFDLYQQGYDVFILDHRGQGLSTRLLPNLNKGYVTKFQDYVDDLHYFIEHIVIKYNATKPYLLAHSMGGAIAVRFMQDSSNAIKAAVIASPMLGFNSGYIPTSLATKVVTIKLALNNLISKSPWYFLGQKDYAPVTFIKNKLTHSRQRYQVFVNTYKHTKSIQLGGVTTHWIMQGIIAQKEIFSRISQLKTPILLLQASDDIVVCLKAQNDFCLTLHTLQPKLYPNSEPVKIEGAYHELFFELDEYRDKAITQSIAWFKQHA